MRSTWPMRAAAAALLTILAGLPADAKPVTVTPGNPPVTVDVPAAWKASKIDRGIQAKTADDEVFVWFESYRPAQFKTLLDEHNAYFKKQGVAITGQGASQEKDFPTYVVKTTDYPATYEGKRTILRYISVAPKDTTKRELLVSIWASPEGETTYAADLDTIFKSFRASVEGL
ncbi:hypothetical protein ASG40_04045 [Methylobacterium sp. Leaf399]|uniref:hypothetical protein n=1 Tax=unclassified Methylobacterium TaxID=2615210 RepID=UPI0006FA60EE|nr:MULTISPECIES: hypothetical protein [unclassified Methylobacterium]KQP61699.1 hypothetical protein ASF39_03265 [Methylobacterium sp. Leaf108]KQT19979.1 hypothetical protein ASG40_04045 [Methylobacterium sp. Leaf399]KQT78497.1 hypothetical protein ASG59_08470 [Methylobacterium sp. Leaf466]